MILESINLSTGPVSISPEVSNAFHAPAISHRSQEFRKLFDKTLEQLCSMVAAQQVFVMSGSGTLANDAMLYQVRATGKKGLILSNGEFGSRLVSQAERIGVDFLIYEVGWGEALSLEEIRSHLSTGGIHWVLFCHCETSTGKLNELQHIAALCSTYKCLCFVDCISSIGNIPLDLSKVTMATASSGKGLAAFAGLALLFCNIEPVQSIGVPVYLDVTHYAGKNFVPFTISSNLVSALYTSIVQKNKEHLPEVIHEYSSRYFDMLNAYDLVPFGTAGSKVFTIVFPGDKNSAFIDHMQNRNILLSYESEYLKKRNWSQLAVFGYYRKSQLSLATSALEYSLNQVLAG
jgi:aspartate aminotransferase-like enzyme